MKSWLKGMIEDKDMWGITVGAEFAEPFQIIRIVE